MNEKKNDTIKTKKSIIKYKKGNEVIRTGNIDIERISSL